MEDKLSASMGAQAITFINDRIVVDHQKIPNLSVVMCASYHMTQEKRLFQQERGSITLRVDDPMNPHIILHDLSKREADVLLSQLSQVSGFVKVNSGTVINAIDYVSAVGAGARPFDHPDVIGIRREPLSSAAPDRISCVFRYRLDEGHQSIIDAFPVDEGVAPAELLKSFEKIPGFSALTMISRGVPSEAERSEAVLTLTNTGTSYPILLNRAHFIQEDPSNVTGKSSSPERLESEAVKAPSGLLPR